MQDRTVRLMAASGLAIGGLLGMAGSFMPSASLRGLAWGLDGTALVIACALLCVHFLRQQQDLVAAGFLVFAVGEGLILTGAPMDLVLSIPSFGAGAGLWAAALAMISSARVFPLAVRALGYISCVLFSITAVRIYLGEALSPMDVPLPFNAYPVFVATLFGWIWTLLRTKGSFAPAA